MITISKNGGCVFMVHLMGRYGSSQKIKTSTVGNMEANKITKSGDQYDFLERNLPRVIRSNGTIEDFNPSRIKDSILKETSIPEGDAHLITEEIVKKMLTSNQEMITAPFIREQVCIALFERKPKWRFEYTRLGMPYHDFKKKYSGFFDVVINSSDLDNGAMEKILSSMDKDHLVDLVRRMAKDYIGVRNNIKNYE